MTPELFSMLVVQTREAIAAKREDAVHMFDAFVAATRAKETSEATQPTNDKPEPARLVTQAELCELLGIKPRTAQVMTQDGRIPAEAVIRAGRSVRYDFARIVEALRGKRTSAASWGARMGGLRAIDGGAK